MLGAKAILAGVDPFRVLATRDPVVLAIWCLLLEKALDLQDEIADARERRLALRIVNQLAAALRSG